MMLQDDESDDESDDDDDDDDDAEFVCFEPRFKANCFRTCLAQSG